MGASRSGSCACGAIHYDVAADPLVVLNCHCRDCQRASGTAFSTVAVFPAVAVAVRGAPKWRATTADSGNVVRRAFCPECGSPMFSASAAMPALLVIKVASFDDPAPLKPTFDIWTDGALPWAVLDPATRKAGKNLDPA